MGWNDRLPEDPYWPAHSDAEAYEEWHRYLELCRLEDIAAMDAGANLTSQTIDPAQIKLRQTQEEQNARKVQNNEKQTHDCEKEEVAATGDDVRPF